MWERRAGGAVGRGFVAGEGAGQAPQRRGLAPLAVQQTQKADVDLVEDRGARPAEVDDELGDEPGPVYGLAPGA